MKNNLNPLVTVYMPTHKRGALINKAIDSVLSQSYKNLELIVCIDGFDGNTKEVLESYIKFDDRIKYVVNDVALGACHARNRCINIAKGEFITGLDDDDEFTPERIELFIKHFNSTADDIICTGRVYFDGEKYKKGNQSEGYITIEMLSNANLIGNQIFTRTSYMKEVNCFDTNFPAWQDYDMWFRLIKHFGKCYKLSVPTYIFHVDDSRPRITTGSKAHEGYQCFIEKHREALTKNQLRNLNIQDLLNRNQKLLFVNLINNFTCMNFKIYVKEKLKKIKLIVSVRRFLLKL
ncbi:glycosyltransferase [Tatumella ptyseos]|uniref:glycosyltransferase n=1 Tax=Tatumella ptyseos TaxID=82987 RepID=UPI0026F0C67C|nr:glycosyltransferase [Tatumella ptyseos]WKX27169.1 glycosyltransferase [Tatumella ptyseos]